MQQIKNSLAGPAILPTAKLRVLRLWSIVWAYCDRTWLHACTIAGLSLAVFANSLKNGFHLDDFYRVVENPGIMQITRPWQHFVDPTTMSTLDRIAGYRPILPLSLSINYALSKYNVVSYHVVNILIQIAAAWLVYRLSLKLLSLAPAKPASRIDPATRRALAWCVALIFAVHPVSGIPVNYICARDQLLSQLFWSGSLVTYLRMHERGFSVGRWFVTLALLSASLLSKGDAVLAPLAILALQFTVFGQPLTARRPWLHAAAFAVPVTALFFVQSYAFGRSEVAYVVANTDRLSYALTQARLHLFRYLPQFVWPFPIRVDPAIPLATGLSLPVACGVLFMAVSLWLAWRWRREQPIWSFCILAYWIMLAPTSSVIPLHHLAVDYRPYPSSPFLFLAVGLALTRIKIPMRSLIAAGAITWCATCSVLLNRTWLDETSLWTYSVQHGGGPLAYLNLAMAKRDLRARRVLLEKALALEPGYILAMLNLGRVLVVQEEVAKGLGYIERSVQLNPKDAQLRYWYARTLVELKRTADASRESVLAAQMDPRNPRAVYQAYLATKDAGDSKASLHWLEVLKNKGASQADPDEEGFARGFALQQQGKLDEAIAEYRTFLVLHPNHMQVHFNLGFALMTKKECELAIPEFERVLQLDPFKAAAHLHLATCSRAIGNLAVAQLHQTTWDESQRSKQR